jgi:hypothetical protein
MVWVAILFLTDTTATVAVEGGDCTLLPSKPTQVGISVIVRVGIVGGGRPTLGDRGGEGECASSTVKVELSCSLISSLGFFGPEPGA